MASQIESYDKRKSALIQEITTAFDGVVREDGVSLHEAQVLDDYGGPEERAQARAKDIDKTWKDVPEKDISSTDAVLSFLDAKGFRYYIPAYMVWYLRNIDSRGCECCNSNTFGSVTFHLTYKVEENKDRKFQLLTVEQSRAIAHFLILEAEREEAFERKWLRASLFKGGMSKADVDSIVQAHSFEDSSIRIALSQYWQQFV